MGRLNAVLCMGLMLLAAPAGAAVRLVSLAPNVTELVFAAGAGSRLVGVSEFSDYPADARRLPRIGNAFRVDEERVIGLAPTHVLAWRTGTPPTTIGRLQQLGLRVIVLDTQRLDDIAAAIDSIGMLAGTQVLARRAAGRFRQDLSALRPRPAVHRPVRVFVEVDDEPLYTVAANHVVNEIISRCGGRNIFADLPGVAPVVTLESVIARDPELILVADDTVVEPRQLWKRWPELRAVRNQQVIRIPGDILTRPTPRILEGARAVCAAIAGAESIGASR
ncbi:MAG: cobalamin-binding protein [Steroidobacteraceae bacterium]